MRKYKLSPKLGVDPVRLVPPPEFHGKTIQNFLDWRFPTPPVDWAAAIIAGEFKTGRGEVVHLLDVIKPGLVLYVHLPIPEETTLPVSLKIIYENEFLIAIDKPHFMAAIPRGMHIKQSALVQLRLLTGIDHITPAHRLDRLTAGVMLFVKIPRYRAAYQTLFEKRAIKKTYFALAPDISNVTLPLLVKSRIIKTPGILKAVEATGEINAITYITEPNIAEVEVKQPIPAKNRVYKLIPYTGKTHQLRLHMARIGAPILGDPLYGTVEFDSENYEFPLRLLAKKLEFIDPVTKVKLRLESQLEL